MPEYVIKFFSKKEYADTLINGIFYMNHAGYYRKKEEKEGQWDFTEGALSHETAIAKGLNYPIYCMYAVDETDIINNTVYIDKKIIDDFNCANGYAVVIRFNDFEKLLESCDTKGYTMVGDLVQYGTLSNDEMKHFFKEKSCSNLFVKRPCFSYQHEYRIVIYKNIVKSRRNNCESCNEKSQNEFHEEFHIDKSIKDKAKLISIKECHKSNDKYAINLC